MIPVLADFRIQVEQGRRWRIWFPLPVLWVLLLPFAIVLLPVFVAYCLRWECNPITALVALGRLMAALAHTHIEVESRDVSILIAIH